jgi:hypothetical protein
MARPDSRGSPKLPLLVAAIVASLVVACDRPQPTAPTARAALPGAPSRTLDPGQDYTGDPNDGCWIAPDSSVFEGSPTYGGIYPYEYVRCDVSMNVWWPGLANGVDWPFTAVFNGNAIYDFPWGHRPGYCCGVPPATGFPWTITFGKPVRNVRVYTRWVDFPGGVVRVKSQWGSLIAEKPIPVRPTSIGGRDTISFADTNVYIVEIVPDRDPNYPPDAIYPDKREFMGWQAQFEPPPDTLCKGPTQNPAHTAPFNDVNVRRIMEQMLKDSDTLGPPSSRREQFGYVRRNPDGSHRIDRVEPDARLNHCENRIVVPSDPTILAVVHTHPYRDQENMRCPGKVTQPGQPPPILDIPYDGAASDGGSTPDWLHKIGTNFAREGAGLPKVPYYVIDVDFAYFMHPDALAGERANFRISRRGGPGGCKWVL